MPVLNNRWCDRMCVFFLYMTIPECNNSSASDYVRWVVIAIIRMR